MKLLRFETQAFTPHANKKLLALQIVVFYLSPFFLLVYWFFFVFWFALIEAYSPTLLFLSLPLVVASFAMVQAFFITLKNRDFLHSFFAVHGVLVAGLIA